MSQIFDDQGNALAATLISAGPCYITQIKTSKKDGYNAVQMGFSKAKSNKKPQQGHLRKAKIKEDLQYLTEMRVKDKKNIAKMDGKDIKPGDKIDVSIFNKKDQVDIVGRSKGKGFAGTIKRHNFSRGPVTHGSHNIRQPGAIGMCSFPGRVFKGKKMPGRMGGKRVTVKNLKIINIIPEKNILVVSGAVPGPTGEIVGIKG